MLGGLLFLLLASFTCAGNFTILGMMSLPQGDFGDDFSLSGGTGSNGGSGGAENGFGVGGEFSVPLQASNQMFITTTGLFVHNSIDLSSFEESPDPSVSITADADGWNNFAILSGVKFTGRSSPTMGFYGMGQIGINFVSLGDMDISADQYDSYYDTYSHIDLNTSTDIASSLALAFGGGIEVNRFNIGLRYLMLGKPKLKTKLTITQDGTTQTAHGSAKKEISILVLLVGYNF
jgi:hypothetical protein